MKTKHKGENKINLLTTIQTAKLLGVNPSRVRQFILAGRLPAQKIGRDLFVKEQDVLKFKKLKRLHGRPKTKEN